MSDKSGKLRQNQDLKVYSEVIAERLGSVVKAAMINHIAFQMGRALNFGQATVAETNGIPYYLSTRGNFLKRMPQVDGLDEAYDSLIEDGIIEEIEIVVGNSTTSIIYIVDRLIRFDYNLTEEF